MLKKLSLLILIFSFFSSLSPSFSMEYCPYCGDDIEKCFTVRTAVATKSVSTRGRWTDQITPKRGWTFIRAEDLGVGVTQQCEMCQKEKPRYIHHMQHGNAPTLITLKVGCVCAAYMEGHLDNDKFIEGAIKAAEKRQRFLKNLADNRIKAFHSPGVFTWEPRDDEYPPNLNTLFLKKGGKMFPGYIMAFRNEDELTFSYNVRGKKGSFSTMEEAKAAAILELRNHIGIN